MFLKDEEYWGRRAHISYGDMVALSGDFYSDKERLADRTQKDPEKPIKELHENLVGGGEAWKIIEYFEYVQRKAMRYYEHLPVQSQATKFEKQASKDASLIQKAVAYLKKGKA